MQFKKYLSYMLTLTGLLGLLWTHCTSPTEPEVILEEERSFPERKEIDVRYHSEDGTRLAGTIFLPLSDGPHPAVVLQSGSGPWTRHLTPSVQAFQAGFDTGLRCSVTTNGAWASPAANAATGGSRITIIGAPMTSVAGSRCCVRDRISIPNASKPNMGGTGRLLSFLMPIIV